MCLKTGGMVRLEFQADANNARSVTAMKAIGFMEEGILRNHMPTATGGRRNSIILSIIKTKWFGGVKDLLRQKNITPGSAIGYHLQK